MSTTWHGLSLQQTSSPPLLFQYTWTRQGYALCVTDLTSIWTEKLSHKEILNRAEEISTTIDPSEDQEQFNVLLVKIGEALRGDGGSATLNSGSQGSLELSTSSKLPAPLRPLKWTLYLSKGASSSLTDHLLLPLLKDEAGWESRQRVLLDQLKQKDWALGKLLDKFESLGVELGTVFPGAAGLRTTKKGSTRSDAGKFVKGLAPFDESAWLRESGSSSESSGLAANILHELGVSRADVEKIRAPQDKWWDDLPKRSETAASQSDKNVTTPEDSTSQMDELAKASQQDRDLDLDQDGNSTASDDDDFQRQETPPRIKAQRQKLAASSSSKSNDDVQPSNTVPDIHAGEATASDSEPEADAAPQKRTPIPTKPSPPAPETKESPKKPTKARGRLGAIGGKKKEEKQPSPAPSSPSPPPAPSPVPTPRKPKGGKLGMIGGKAKSKAPEASSQPPAATAAAPERKQERLNESSDLDNPAEVMADPVSKVAKPQVPASREKESAEPVAEETEEQKTARKREELKRQLEEKSKAPKKKRRF
ncbi:XLF/Cernunnos protein [Penicillium pulvis]|uniref:XLF/Cernunnos protein n=1 Tax=Penicillium pulvis TaxID=1562058 RepID=UPI002546ADC3|nr:XLF/Cernunnos protein [Penicillium pulvis]KAJ5805629.1 XLF/Cernunnos protein [Penicillium pulvis]